MNFTSYSKKFHNCNHTTEREKDVTKIQLEKELLKKQKEKERNDIEIQITKGIYNRLFLIQHLTVQSAPLEIITQTKSSMDFFTFIMQLIICKTI